MRRKKVTGRFYIFLLLLLVGGFFILRELIPDAAQEAVVTVANATYTQTVDAVIVRDETVTSYEGNGRVVFVASEGQVVRAGDTVCTVYSAGYSEKEIERLETVRQNIRAYHETILSNIVDADLDRLEQNVENLAVQIKRLINRRTTGSLLNLEKQLEEALVARQDYLRQNRREDPRLNQLYEEETKRLNNIASWETAEKADRDGIVSFYMDGCESFLTPANLPVISVDDVRAILAGKTPASTASRLMTPVFRVVASDRWYVILLSSDTSWNPITGQTFSFRFEDYDEAAFTGTVTQLQKTTDEVMVQLEVNASPEMLMNKRYGRANLGVSLSGLSVPVRALVTQSGQTGVMLSDTVGNTFIPVEVLSSDGRNALVQPIVEGTLALGQRVLLQ